MKISEARRVQLLNYASGVMASRPPDLLIGQSTRRWLVWPKNNWGNIYIHEWVGDDMDQALHDHAPDNLSVILSGKCNEHFNVKPLVTELLSNGERNYKTYSLRRTQGDVVFRLAGTAHKITLVDGPMISMFIQGPRRRDWGFHCVNGWKPWQEYIDARKGYGDRSGKGCGE